MNFDFFTFGGAVFWEDVFFYQKWRIQRHCFTHTYRLLDSWDIRRASGSFEICQKAFVKYINCYEMTKQEGKMVVLLHGYMDSKNIFKKLWRKFDLIESTVVALNYPSLFKSASESAQQLLFFLNHIDNVTEVSFVTKGMGNLVLQKMFNLSTDKAFSERMRIGNIVEINPVIDENIVCDFLGQFKFFDFICGPSLKDMMTKQLKHTPNLPPQIKYLQIFSDSKPSQILSSILRFHDFLPNKDYTNRKNAIYIKGNTFCTLNDDEILNITVKFIKNGKI